MKKYIPRSRFLTTMLLTASLAASSAAIATGGVEDSYHGQLGWSGFGGYGTGLGMLEKWCALPNFSFIKQGGIGDGTFGWTSMDCNGCHIGAPWNPTRPAADCTFCHATPNAEPTIADCYRCHSKDTAKRGDMFDAANDVHIAAGMLCHDCHERVTDQWSDHQFLKGTAIDTTDPTMEGTLNCATCHSTRPHWKHVARGGRLNHHADRVACETCHTGPRPGAALTSRSWNTFTAAGSPVTAKKPAGWLPVYKWYDNVNSATSGGSHLPILGYTERRDRPGAKIYPFNPVSVSWFLETSLSALDDVVIVPDVKMADANGDLTTTVAEMQVFYPDATLVTEDMNFSISHSITPVAQAKSCDNCHGATATTLDWLLLGYAGDPSSHGPLIETFVTPDSGDFGRVAVGNQEVRQIEIKNIGDSDLTITDISLSGSNTGMFAIDLNSGPSPCGSTSFSLAPGDSCTLALLYEPTKSGSADVTLNIASNDAELPVVAAEFTASSATVYSVSDNNGAGGCAAGTTGRIDLLLAGLFLWTLFANVLQRISVSCRDADPSKERR